MIDPYGSKEDMQKGVNEIMAMVKKLQPGQSCVYHTGFTGWIDALPYSIGEPLTLFFADLREEGKHSFCQRKVDEDGYRGIFEYICKRVK